MARPKPLFVALAALRLVAGQAGFGCNPDDLLWNLTFDDNIDAALAFCSSFLNVPQPQTYYETLTTTRIASTDTIDISSSTSTTTTTATSTTRTTSLVVVAVISTSTTSITGVTVTGPPGTTTTTTSGTVTGTTNVVGTTSSTNPFIPSRSPRRIRRQEVVGLFDPEDEFRYPPWLLDCPARSVSSACDWLTVAPSPDTTLTETVYASATETDHSASTAVVTSTSLAVAVTTSLMTSFTTTTVLGATTTATLTSTVFPTQTVLVRRYYEQMLYKMGSPAYVYNEYQFYEVISNDPGPNNDYADAIAECRRRCEVDGCKVFFYYRTDPQYIPDQAFCIRDPEPWDTSYVQNVAFAQFSVGYGFVRDETVVVP